MRQDLQKLIPKAVALASALKTPCFLFAHGILCLLLEEKFQAYLKELMGRHQHELDDLIARLLNYLTIHVERGKPAAAAEDASALANSQLVMELAQLERQLPEQHGYCLPPLVLLAFLKRPASKAILHSFGISTKELQNDIRTMARKHPDDLPAPPNATEGSQLFAAQAELDKTLVQPKALPAARERAKAALPPAEAQAPAARQMDCNARMALDLDLLWENALKLAQSNRNAKATPEHFLQALLELPKYEADLERFFGEHDCPMFLLKKRLELYLDELPKSRKEVVPKLNAACDSLGFELKEWLSTVKFKGYVLPFLCLKVILEFRFTDDLSFAGKLLLQAGADRADYFDEMSQLEESRLQDFTPEYRQYAPESRSTEWHVNRSLSRDFMRLFNGGAALASEMEHAYVMPEHYLMHLLTNEKFEYYLKNLFEIRHKNHLWQLKSELIMFCNTNIEHRKKHHAPPKPTPAADKFLHSLQNSIKSFPCLAFPALALHSLLEINCFARDLLKNSGISREELANDLKNAATGDLSRAAADASAPDTLKRLIDETPNIEGGFVLPEELSEPAKLEQFSTELVEEARKGNIDPLIGRKEELERLIEVLHKKRSSNAIIVGKEGVGKTAVVEGLALRIAQGDVPDTIKDYKIFSIDLGAMIAGADLRGLFEKRLTDCIKESIAQGRNFLFFDEIHNLLGAGTNGNALDASNILKPYLARGQIRCIGATTYEDFQRTFTSNHAFARRFMKISLGEPSREETLQILNGLLPHYEKYHGVKYTPKILEYIVELTARFVTDKFFPDKAIDVMDECGAYYHSGLARGGNVSRQDVERVVCRTANLPSITIQTDHRATLKELSPTLHRNIFGQDEAIAELVQRIKIAKAGFQDPRRPLLTAFLCGTTGCGKTELARQLAAALGCSFVKLDMSEFSEEYAGSRLIGSAPGYIGYERPGALTEPLIQNPNCVLLLDEIEKAHSSVFNMLLQVLDDGRLTDNKGREVSFRNAIILLTSNAGSRAADEAINLLGFAKTERDHFQNRQAIVQRVMKKTFPPEFRNRIQVTLMMNELSQEALEQIVQKTLRMANEQLARQKVTIQLTPKAIETLAAMAGKEHMGGRPVERLFDQYVRQRLVDELIDGKLAHGGKVTIDCHAQTGEFCCHYGK